MPKVSVIIPVFKAEKYIEECARSLFEQTLDDIEYIFVDDCTPDRSMEILQNVLEEYPKRKPQVKIIVMPENSGQAVATRIAIKQATGDYIIRCDSDDYVDKNIYEKLLSASEDGKAEIVVCNKRLFGSGKEYIDKPFKKNEHASRERMISNLLRVYGYPSLCSSLMKKDLFDNKLVFPVGRMGEDVSLLLQLVFFSKSIKYVAEPLYHYRYNPESTCHSPSEEAMWKRMNDLKGNTEIMIQFLKDNGIDDKYKKEIDVAKEAVRSKLFPFLNTKEMIDKWAQIYPEIYWKILFNPYVTLSHKKAVVSKMVRKICRI